MRIEVIESFQYKGKKHGKGEVLDLPESVAESVVEKGYGKRVEEETPKIEAVEDKKKRGPKWKRKIWISEDRNFSISVWPAGDKFDSPNITLEENRKDDSGNWKSNRLYLPTGSSLLALSENMKSAWNEVQKIKSEKKQ